MMEVKQSKKKKIDGMTNFLIRFNLKQKKDIKKNMHWSQGPNVLGIATSKEYCNSGEGYILVFPKNCINIGQNRQFKNVAEHDS